ncbi:MAG: flagellar hook-associated protein FlgK [Hydrogenophilus sp.]|nr:flagellar hook-associated protein FlgK [Hydrogenophilus sp.]
MGMLEIGITGLMAARYRLDTVSHNIANADTPGYSRQRVNVTTQSPQFWGFGFIGRGAKLTNVERAYDQFVQGSLVAAEARYHYGKHYEELIAPINNLVADPEAGLSPALQAFWDATQEVADNPESLAARQSLLSQGGVLTARLRMLDSRFDELRRDVEGRVALLADRITQYGEKIAEANRNIYQAMARGHEAPPNDLLDQRDQLVRELAQYVGIKTIVDEQGLMNVFIGNGQTLVQGMYSATLKAVPAPGDGQRNAIEYQFGSGGAQLLPESMITDGELGAVLAFRREALDAIQNQVGFLVNTLTARYNAQHRLGFGLDGSTNLNFFAGVATSYSATGSSGSTVTIDLAPVPPYATTAAAVAAMRPSAYEYRRVGANYELVRLSDNSVLYSAATPPTAAMTFDGFRFSAAALAAGERVVLRPHQDAASAVTVGLVDPRQVAAAANNPTSLAGTGPGDNGNALALSQLQTAKVLYVDANGNATATFQTGWAAAVAELGATASRVQTEHQASRALADQLKAHRDNYAGVNLDEEAANLIQFQQAYLAASKTMQIAQKLFEEVLAIAR